jgi:hypothetical protein
MPYYEFHCDACQSEETHYRKIVERDVLVLHCDKPMRRIISAPALRPEIQPYISPASGKLISSREQRKEDLAREGCIANEPGLKEHIVKQAQYAKEKAFVPLEKSIDQTVSDLYASGHI